MRLFASNTRQAVTCESGETRTKSVFEAIDNEDGNEASGMNLPRAFASKAQQGPPANSQVRKTLSSPRSHDGEVHAIRHPSADSMPSSVTVPLQHPPFRQTLELNAQRSRPHRKRIRWKGSLAVPPIT